MSYSNVFLLILGLFAMIKNGASLECYETTGGDCLRNQYDSSIFKECLKNAEKSIKKLCDPGDTLCMTLKVTVGEQFVIKGCGASKRDCNVLEARIRYKTECDTCNSDNCNSDQEGEGPSPEVEQNKMSSRSSSSCIHLSVFALFFILGAFFI